MIHHKKGKNMKTYRVTFPSEKDEMLALETLCEGYNAHFELDDNDGILTNSDTIKILKKMKIKYSAKAA